MILMLQNTPVLQFDIDDGMYNVLDENLLPLRLKGIYNQNSSNTMKDLQRNYGAMLDFLSHRVLNLDRVNAKKLLNAYNFSQSQDNITKSKIAVTCKAVSMSDDYWLNDDKQSFSWKTINPRKNSLNKIISHIALTGSSLTINGQPHTPELATQGAYAKAWIREEDGPYLYKASTKGNNESKVEIAVSQILDHFNIPHVKYENAYWNEQNVKLDICKCKVMNNDRYSIVTAEDLYSYCSRINTDFLKQSLSIDKENFYKTCVADYLISNIDRHMQNWGFYMDNKTGILVSNHPLFDHNNAFDRENILSEDGGNSLMLSGYSQKEAAEYAIKKCDIKCIAPLSKKHFLQEEHYESFMKRASDLGLYELEKKTFFQNIFSKTNTYIPKSLYPDAKNGLENFMKPDVLINNETNLFEEKLEELSNEQNFSTITKDIIH